jgi:aliphatic nitrilase
VGNIKTKAAAILSSSVFFNKEKTLEKISDIAGEAASKGARLIVFPETFIPNFPWWIWMTTNNAKKLELFRRLYDQSIEIPGPEIEALEKIAAKLKAFLIVGVNERDKGTLYNSQIFIDDHGNFLGKRRKIMPTGQEKTVWGWGYGNDIRVFDTSIGRIGGLICYEHSMALARYALYSLGEEIHVAGWPGANFKSQPRDRSKVVDAAMRHTAFEGQVFVVFSSSCISKEEVDFYLQLDPSNKEVLSPGGGISGIVDPMGNYIAGPIENEEGIAIGEINSDVIYNAKYMVDTIGHYARNDIFTLLFNNHPNTACKILNDRNIRVKELDLLERWNRLRAVIAEHREGNLNQEILEFECHLRSFCCQEPWQR